ncbi:MAG: hypothetical protein E7628_06700 [Ruminococcaceae bacterium]|nr:hypothetical protein [Oscillospiraceae bacterium]
MIYTIIILLITAVLISLSVLTEKKPDLTRTMMFLNLSLSVIGAALIVLAHILATTKMNHFASNAGFHSWVSDYYQLYYLISLPAFILLFISNTVAALVNPIEKRKMKRISQILRLTVSIASSVLLLLLPYYGLITQNNQLQIYVYIMMSGIGQALIIRLSDMLGLIAKIRNS